MSIDVVDAAPALGRLALSGPTMGTRWAAVIGAPKGPDADLLQAALQQTVDLVDGQMSTWKPQSALMQLNRSPVGVWRMIPEELGHVLSLGLGVTEASGGRFDMAVFHQVEAWGFGPAQDLGDAVAVPRGRGETLELDVEGRRARRLMDVRFDLSGIAKGFAVDLMARAVERLGINDYLVSIDGELQAAGMRPDGAPWQVAVEAPQRDRRDVARVISLSNCSLATSGDYRHGREVGGKWLSHTIDPASGAPVENRLASVTVQAPDCVLADAWATALLVAGEIEGPRLADARGLDALFLVRVGNGWGARGTGCFADASTG